MRRKVASTKSDSQDSEFKKRVEIIITDEEFWKFIERKAKRTDLKPGPYMQMVMRAVYLVEQFGDTSLQSLLGPVAIAQSYAPPEEPEPPEPPKGRADLVDSILDEM